MPKTKEELQQLKNRYESLNNELKELTEEELRLVIGGFANVELEQAGNNYNNFMQSQEEAQQEVNQDQSRIEYAHNDIDALNRKISSTERQKYKN